MDKSQEENKLFLSVTWLDDNEKFVEPVLVPIEELSFDNKNFKPYYIDAESAYLQKHPEEENRIASLERDREEVLNALMIKQKKEEEKEQKIKEAIERKKEEIQHKGTHVIPYTKSKKWGYEYEGTLMTLPKYATASEIDEEGYGYVTRSRKQGVVNRFGEEIVPCHFRSVYPLPNHTFLVDDNDYWSIFKGSRITNVKRGDAVTFIKLNDRLVSIKISREKEVITAIADSNGNTQIIDGVEPFTGTTTTITLQGHWNEGHSWRSSSGYWVYEKKTYSSGKSCLLTELGHIVQKDYESGQEVIIARNLAKEAGLLNNNLEPISDFSYNSIRIAEENIAIVEKNRKYGILMRSNDSIRFKMNVPCLYDSIDIIDTVHIKVGNGGKMGIINFRNEIIVPLKYMSIGEISEDGYAVQKDSRWGKCDITGKEIIEDKQELAEGLFQGLMFEKYGVIDNNGNIVIGFEYDELMMVGNSYIHADNYIFSIKGELVCTNAIDAEVTKEGLLICKNFDYSYLFKNNQQILTDYHISSAEILEDRVHLILSNHMEGAVSLSGNILQEKVTPLGNGLSKYKEMGYWKLAKEDKNIEFTSKYENIVELSNGNIVLVQSKGFSIISKECIVISETNDLIFVKQLNEHLLKVKSNNLFGYCSVDGDLIQKCIFSEISDFENGEAKIIYNRREGAISEKGDLIPDLIEPLTNNLTKQRVLGLWGIKDKNGRWLYPTEYNQILSSGNRYILISDKQFVIINDCGAEIKTINRYRFERLLGDSLIEMTYDGKHGICNMDGMILQDCSYTSIEPISCGFLRTRRIERSYSWRQPDFTYYGLINSSGECLFNCENRVIEILNNSIIHVEYKGRHSAYSFEKEILYEFYQSNELNNGFRKIASANSGSTYGKWGVIDSNWKLIVPCHFDEISMQNAYWFILKKNNKWGCISINLMESFPFRYPNIQINENNQPCVRLGNKIIPCQDYIEKPRLVINRTYTGIVIEIRDYGIMLKIDNQRCLLHISELKKQKKALSDFKQGDNIQVFIKSYDKEKRRYSLGMS